MRRNVYSLFLIIPLIVFGFFLAYETKADGDSDVVSGWAWSENIGWISFNCANTNSCATLNYGVTIDRNSGRFFGYAWSENIGWIDFAPVAPYPASPNYPACLEFPGSGQVCDGIGNYNIGGWARAVSYGGGWDGWIKLRGSNYGVDSTQQSGEFSGYAWSDAVIGWISFSGLNYGVTADPVLFNEVPYKPTTEEVNWNYCAFRGTAVPTFSWTYSDPDGDPQSAYEIEVDENSSFNAPKFNHLVNLASISYVLNLYDDDEEPDDLPLSLQDYQLDWGSTYFWRVRVRDSRGGWSDWSTPSQSKTEKHAAPWVVFTYTPPEPTQGETVDFNPDQTEVFGGVTIISYLWSVTQGTYAFVDGTLASSRYPAIQFATLNNKVNLQVTDSDGYTCESGEQYVPVLLPLPEYKEIPPTF